MFFAELGVLGIIRAEFFWGGKFFLRLVTGVEDNFWVIFCKSMGILQIVFSVLYFSYFHRYFLVSFFVTSLVYFVLLLFLIVLCLLTDQ